MKNTGISLGILLQEGFSETAIPLLQLTFDGTRNENDRTKVDSFLYYLGSRRHRLRIGKGKLRRSNRPQPKVGAGTRRLDNIV
jgi:hypothetical protein